MLLDGNTNTNRNKQTNGKNCTAKSSGVNVYPSYMACNKCDISDNPNENENNMRRSFPHRYHTRVESRCGNMNTAPKWKLGKATTVPVDGLSENWVVRCDIGWLKPSLVMVIIYAAYGGASLIFSIANALQIYICICTPIQMQPHNTVLMLRGTSIWRDGCYYEPFVWMCVVEPTYQRSCAQEKTYSPIREPCRMWRFWQGVLESAHFPHAIRIVCMYLSCE